MSSEVPDEVGSTARLAAVDAIGLQAEDAPDSFQRLVDLAAELVDAPLGFFTVVDADTSWYIASSGVPADVRSGSVEASFCKYVIASGRPLFVEDAAADPVTVGNPAIASMGVRAWAGFPVTDPDGEVLGSFCVVDTAPRTWDERERRIVETLARSAVDEVSRLVVTRREDVAVRLADAATAQVEDLLGRQRDLLALMQHSLLPTRLPAETGLDLAVRYQPTNSTSGLGGDWYDVVDLGDGRTGLVIADVSGHDAQAVAVMAQLRPSLHAFTRGASPPSEVLRQLHLLMVELEIARFLTIFYGIWDPATRTVTYECAGHPPPIVVEASGAASLSAAGRTPLLGVPTIEPVADDQVVELRDGFTLVAYTDGLFERPALSFDDALSAVLRTIEQRPQPTAAATADLLMTACRPDGGWIDDVALLVMRPTS